MLRISFKFQLFTRSKRAVDLRKHRNYCVGLDLHVQCSNMCALIIACKLNASTTISGFNARLCQPVDTCNYGAASPRHYTHARAVASNYVPNVYRRHAGAEDPPVLVFIISERSQYLAIPETDLESNVATDVAVNLVNVGQYLFSNLEIILLYLLVKASGDAWSCCIRTVLLYAFGCPQTTPLASFGHYVECTGNLKIYKWTCEPALDPKRRGMWPSGAADVPPGIRDCGTLQLTFWMFRVVLDQSAILTLITLVCSNLNFSIALKLPHHFFPSSWNNRLQQ